MSLNRAFEKEANVWLLEAGQWQLLARWRLSRVAGPFDIGGLSRGVATVQPSSGRPHGVIGVTDRDDHQNCGNAVDQIRPAIT